MKKYIVQISKYGGYLIEVIPLEEEIEPMFIIVEVLACNFKVRESILEFILITPGRYGWKFSDEEELRHKLGVYKHIEMPVFEFNNDMEALLWYKLQGGIV